MNINQKKEVTYDITEITETQARDLLAVAVDIGNNEESENYYTLDQLETLNNLRQALLNVGVQKQGAA